MRRNNRATGFLVPSDCSFEPKVRSFAKPSIPPQALWESLSVCGRHCKEPTGMLRLNDTAPLGSLSIAPRVAKRQGKSRHSWANLMHTGSFILSVKRLLAQWPRTKALNSNPYFPSTRICGVGNVTSPLSLIFPPGQYKVRL